jgi:hypothetical protein
MNFWCWREEKNKILVKIAFWKKNTQRMEKIISEYILREKVLLMFKSAQQKVL